MATNAHELDSARGLSLTSAGQTRLRARELGSRGLIVNETGRFASCDLALMKRLERGTLTPEDEAQLRAHRLTANTELERLADLFAVQKRRCQPNALDYLILVPTLRCNLACSYCQVARVAENARGFDWDERTLAAVVNLIGQSTARHLKIEFQGGEPTLRCDLIRAVIDAVPDEIEASFVVCTNLQDLRPEVLELFDRPNVSISTSLDGPLLVHTRQRLSGLEQAQEFTANVQMVLKRYSPGKLSALPTIDPVSLPDQEALIDAYAALGLTSIFLRPINYQGFARKRHAGSREIGQKWRDYHASFIRRLIERNWRDASRCYEETYFSILLRRIFRPGQDRHVDLRNPNPIGVDYVVIDYDGRVYPTDEARMLSRAGVIDLAIGDAQSGWDTPARAALHAASTNDGDPTCETCAYKPFCGRDLMDDIARYGTIDLPREETEFCQRHTHLFDLAFELIHFDDPAVQHSLRQWLGIAGNVSLGALL